MPALESKIAGAVLSRIRMGQASVLEPETPVRANSSAKITVREANVADFEIVSALCTRLGQGPDSPENWKRLWRDNPAVLEGHAPSRVGWVLESDGEGVGFLGTIPLLYEFEGKVLVAAATCRFAVDPAYRGFSNLLMTSFLRQKDVDLFLNTTATVAAGKIMSALKAANTPQRDYGKVLFWVLDARGFTQVVLGKMGLNSRLGSALSVLGMPAIRIESTVRRRKPRTRSKTLTVSVTGVNDLGTEFDEFVGKGRVNSACLMAVRSASTMSWHFSPPGSQRIAKVLSCYSAGRLSGYAVVRHETEAKTGLRRSSIADLLADGDDQQVVEQLLAAAYDNAREQGSHILELMGFPESIRAVARKSNPYSRDYPSNPFFYKARDKDLQAKLTGESAWYACPFDGDATLWP